MKQKTIAEDKTKKKQNPITNEKIRKRQITVIVMDRERCGKKNNDNGNAYVANAV